MVLGRMVYYYLPEQKLFHIPGTRFSRYFVWLDILAFLVQLGGGMIVSGTNVKPKTMQLGIHIYMGGIGLQQFFILMFTALAIMFHRRVNELKAQGQYVEPGWKRLLFTLYGSLALITVSLFSFYTSLVAIANRSAKLRIIYRLVEYASGNGPNSPLPYHEAYFYCLDGTPMFLAALIMCISHPGHFLKGPNSEFPKLSRKEKKAAKAAAKAAKKGAKDHAKLLDPEEGYGGMGGSEVELEQRPYGAGAQTAEYSRVEAAPGAQALRYEPYGAAYGQDEYYSMGLEAGRTLS